MTIRTQSFTMHWSAMVAYALGQLFLFVFILVVGVYIIGDLLNGVFGPRDIVWGLLSLLALLYFILFTRYPLKTTVGHDRLYVFGLRGTKFIELEKLTAVKAIPLLLRLRSFGQFFLILEDSEKHRIFLELSSLSRSDRVKLWKVLKPYTEKPTVEKSKYLRDFINTWSLEPDIWPNTSQTR